MPPTRQRPCSDSAREGSVLDAAAQTSGLWSTGASEKQAENTKADLGRRGPRSKGEAAPVKAHELRRPWSE